MPAKPIDNGFFDPTVAYPMWKTPVTIDPRTTENYLFNRSQDPGQNNNLWDSHIEVRNQMLVSLKSLLLAEGCPDEQLTRLGLNDV